jgi:hypothetical protein
MLLCLIFVAPPAHATTPLEDGYRAMYNRDFAAAHAHFATWMAAHPEDPMGPISDAAAFMFPEFDRLNIIDVQLFGEPDPNAGHPLPPTSAAVRTNFNQRLDQGEKLADAILAKSPKDAHALYAKMMIYGLRADFAEMIDKSDYKALKFSEKGADYSVQALQADPHLYDAHIATGFENYMLSMKPMAVRFVVRLMGGQTDKNKGITELKITSQQGIYLAPFAQILLAVAELREGNKEQAKAILAELAKQFPENPMYEHQLERIH